MNAHITVGAASLMGALVAGTGLFRWWCSPVPSGRHRAVRANEETVPLAELMRPQAAEGNDIAYCPAERRDTMHAFNADRTRTCWTCRCTTPTAVPRG